MEPSCPLGTTRCIPQANFHQKPYNKSFIYQICSVKMAGYSPRSFFASLWTSTSSRSINTQKKKKLGQYPAILTSHLVNNPYIRLEQASLVSMLLYGTRKQNKRYSVSNASGIFFSNGPYGIRSRPRKALPWTTPFCPPSSLFPLILVADFSLPRLVGAIYRLEGLKKKG